MLYLAELDGTRNKMYINFIKENIYIIYPICTTVIFFILFIFFRHKIKKTRNLRITNLKKLKVTGAIETDSPISNHAKVFKTKGLHDIEGRFSFMNNLLPLVLTFIWFVLVITPYLGKIPTVYISIIAAIFSVAAGVSLKPFLENLFSGIVISFFKSIRVGDTVIIDDHYGIIEQIGLTYSVLKRWDWNRVVIPNSKLLQKEVQNLTMNDKYIWTYVEFFISPDTDIEKVERLSIDIAKHSPFFNGAEEPSFWIIDFQKDTVKCWVVAWADNPSVAWELRTDIRVKLLTALQQEKIQFHKINLDSNIHQTIPSTP